MWKRLLSRLLEFLLTKLVSNFESLKDTGVKPPRISFMIKGERVQVVLLPGPEALSTLPVEPSTLQYVGFFLIRCQGSFGMQLAKLAKLLG